MSTILIQNLFLLQILAAIQILKKKDIVLMGRQPTESWGQPTSLLLPFVAAWMKSRVWLMVGM